MVQLQRACSHKRLRIFTVQIVRTRVLSLLAHITGHQSLLTTVAGKIDRRKGLMLSWWGKDLQQIFQEIKIKTMKIVEYYQCSSAYSQLRLQPFSMHTSRVMI